MKWKMLMVALTLGGLISIGGNQVSASDNKPLYGAGQRDIYGGDYYPTSSIREWMNSKEADVRYTNQSPAKGFASPAYDQEPGFLTSFTDKEMASIAVTEHKAYLSTSDASVADGGSGQFDSNPFSSLSARFSVSAIDSSTNRSYQLVKDKVFLLSPYQYYQFIERRNLPYQKSLTAVAKKKYNRTETYSYWWLQGAMSNIGTENNYFVSNSNSTTLSRTQPSAGHGFVPAMHVFPDTMIQNKKISEYKIGSVVEFGSYMGEKIEWKIINKTKSGFPLLLSEKILDLRSIDATGDDYSLAKSLYIDFPTNDVSWQDSENYASYEGYNDTEEPTFIVTNEDKLFSRSNDSFVVEFSVEDKDSGVDYIILPNNQIVRTPKFSYMVNQNTIYHFMAVDKAGNRKVFALPVANINPESSVLIKSSADGWTNKDVQVDISATNVVGTKNRSYLLTQRSYNMYNFPNFTSYANKKIRVTGEAEVTRNDGKNNPSIGVGFYYRSSFKRGNDYFLQNVWTHPIYTSSIRSMQDKGKVTYDMVYELPGNYFDSLSSHHQIGANVGDYNYSVQFTNNSYELLDNDDFGIEKIILPDGKEIHQSSYRDTLKKDGSYSYKVIDNRGKTTEKTIEVKIDKDAPDVTVTPQNKNWTKNEYELVVNATDALSGVKELVLPNGQVYKGSSFRYLVNDNGTYTFSAVDESGNKRTVSYVVSNFDKTPPALTVKSNNEWTNQKVTLNVEAKDDGVGVDSIRLPSGEWVKGSTATYSVERNGRYTFTTRDKLGNERAYEYLVQNIDKNNPIIQVKMNHFLLEGKTVVNIQIKDI